jgi:hypothetical protein
MMDNIQHNCDVMNQLLSQTFRETYVKLKHVCHTAHNNSHIPKVE